MASKPFCVFSPCAFLSASIFAAAYAFSLPLFSSACFCGLSSSAFFSFSSASSLTFSSASFFSLFSSSFLNFSSASSLAFFSASFFSLQPHLLLFLSQPLLCLLLFLLHLLLSFLPHLLRALLHLVFISCACCTVSGPGQANVSMRGLNTFKAVECVAHYMRPVKSERQTLSFAKTKSCLRGCLGLISWWYLEVLKSLCPSCIRIILGTPHMQALSC